MSEIEQYEKQLDRFFKNIDHVFTGQYAFEFSKPLKGDILLEELIKLLKSTPYEWICFKNEVYPRCQEEIHLIRNSKNAPLIYGGPWFVEKWFEIIQSLKTRLKKNSEKYKAADEIYKLLTKSEIIARYDLFGLLYHINEIEKTLEEKEKTKIEFIDISDWFDKYISKYHGKIG